MSLETVYLERELQKLDTAHEKLKTNEESFRTQILASDFLTNYSEFEEKLSDFSNSVITFSEVVHNPVEGLPTELPLAEEEEERNSSESNLNYPKAILLGAVVVMTSVIAVYQLIPPMTPIYVGVGCACLAFSPQLISVIKDFLHRHDENEPELVEDWITDSLQKIRELYRSARFLMKVQTQTKENLPNYELLHIDQALYDRKQHFAELLPSEFLGRIAKIVVACDRNFWIRKSLVINAITATKQAAMTKT